MLRRFNLNLRMLLSIGFISFIVIAITIAYFSVSFRNAEKQSAMTLSEEMAARYGAMVKADLEVAMDTARTIAQTAEGLINDGYNDREVVNSILKHVLESNPDFVAVWTYWEANAFDGKDSEFVNTVGTDQSGRFIPYWNRDGNSVKVDAIIDYETEFFQNYLTSGKEQLLDPYMYPVGDKEVLMTSVMIPIFRGSSLVGVAGIDITLAALSEVVSGIKVFDSGYGALLSNDGTFVAHRNLELAGKNMIDFIAEDIKEAVSSVVRNGESYDTLRVSKVTGKLNYQVYTPIKIGNTTTPWSFVIIVPEAEVMAKANAAFYTSIIIGLVSFIALMMVVFFIARGISGPMNHIIAGLNESANQVSTAVNQVSSSSQILAEGASEQAASIEETSASLEEMSSMTRQTAENAQEADTLMKDVGRIADSANQSMANLTQSMDEISKASEETSSIIKTIDEIAFQTNLLALNAAVEAARAGEAGAGFAVVADEVRNLALRAAEAARNTSVLIEATVTKVNSGSEMVKSASEAFDQVNTATSKVGDLVAEISGASSEQAQGIGQVNTTITQMDKVTQQNAASAEESASSSEEMRGQAESMKHMVSRLVALVTGNKE